MMPQVEKLRNAIDKMAKVIQSKDLQLKLQQQAYQKDRAKCLNISHLSAVCHFQFHSIPFKATIEVCFLLYLVIYLGTKRSYQLFGKWN